MERIGIFGGTFDPIHVGHLVAATWCRDALALDRTLLVVAGEPWQKVATRNLSSAQDRFSVVEAAVEGFEGLEPSRIEIDREGPSYTADTVHELRESFPESRLYLIVGSDVAADLGTWQRIDEIEALVTLVVVERSLRSTTHSERTAAEQGAPRDCGDKMSFRRLEFGRVEWSGGVEHVQMPTIDVSSSELRERIRQGRSVDFLIPAPAIRLIEELGLYCVSR